MTGEDFLHLQYRGQSVGVIESSLYVQYLNGGFISNNEVNFFLHIEEIGVNNLLSSHWDGQALRP